MTDFKWISIEEQKPNKMGWYLIFYPESEDFPHKGSHVDMCFWNKRYFNKSADTGLKPRDGFTHYFQLPDMPEETTENEKSDWVLIDKQKPRELGWYLLFYPESRGYKNWGWYVGMCFWNGEYFDDISRSDKKAHAGFTHYSPIPETPKGE